MRQNKSLPSTATVRFDTSSKPAQSYAKNARLSITNKMNTQIPSNPHHIAPDELLSISKL